MSLEQPIPTSVVVCPYCGGQLHLEVDEWDYETGVPTEAGVHASCEHETDSGRDHYEKPYVYWLPVIGVIHRWILKTGLTVPRYTKEEEQERLKAWNEGKPL